MNTGSALRWWSACATGVAVSVPLAWLLSYAAALPFYLGLFFFVVFGLMIGAAVHRVAAPGRPYGRWSVLLGTTLMVAFCWSASMVKESRDFPQDIGVEATRRARELGGRTVAEHRTLVADAVRRHLADRYPPGGVSGYVRWALTRGEFKKGEIERVDHPVRGAQGRWGWAVRVVLSVGLLAFGLGSQTLPLARTKDATEHES